MPMHPGTNVLGKGLRQLVTVKNVEGTELIGLSNMLAPEYTETNTHIEVPNVADIRSGIPAPIVETKMELKFNIQPPNASVRRLMLGGDAAIAVAGHDYTEWEYATIPSAPGPYTVTLAAAVVDDLIHVQLFVGNNSWSTLYEAAAAVEDKCYTRSGTTLTFAAENAGDRVRIRYMSAAAGTNGMKETWKLSDLPSIVQVVWTTEAFDIASGKKMYRVRHYPRVQITSGRSFKEGDRAVDEALAVTGVPLPINDGTSASDNYFYEYTTYHDAS